MRKKIMLLGSGELGKEFAISAQRLGQYIIAVDRYDHAPAMAVANEREIISMLDPVALDAIVEKHKPDIIVPEIEAICTERLYEYEAQGMHVVPSAKAANFTMNRSAIRDLAALELGIQTAQYRYANNYEEFLQAVQEIGMPCVVKPLMSSSGKGQSIVKSEEDIARSWGIAAEKGRTGDNDVIVEEFIPFDSEITVLTVTQKNGETLFCPPIGHRQERGDYQESWQPAPVAPDLLEKAHSIAKKITEALSGAGIWGVEFFLTKTDVYFSELSPRPHDTGMVTLAGTTNLNEFELHIRAILGLPIPEIVLKKAGASAVILADADGLKYPCFEGLDSAMADPIVDVRIFGKPETTVYRRMGVAVAGGTPETSIELLRETAKKAAAQIRIVPGNN